MRIICHFVTDFDILFRFTNVISVRIYYVVPWWLSMTDMC